MKPPKKKKALWTNAFPDQAKALRPECSKAGGVKSRSQSEAIRMVVYTAINNLYHQTHFYCECCRVIPDFHELNVPHEGPQTHHVFGRDGLLLFDVRGFKSCCLRAHQWIDANRDKARELGLLAKKGDWNKIT